MGPTESETLLACGRYLVFVSRDGYEYVRRARGTGIVAVLAVTDSRRVVLVEQYRVPLNQWVIELPAGLAGDHPSHADESLAEAAVRELREETGYEAEGMELLMEGPGAAGISASVITIFRARGIQKVGPGGGDGTEQLRVHEVELHRLPSWLDEKRREGVTVDLKLYAALHALNEDAAGGKEAL